MIKDPALHITRTVLEKLLLEVPAELDAEGKSWWILQHAKAEALNYRMQPQLSKKTYDKLVHKRTTVNEDYIATFNKVYSQQARELGNMGVDLINAHHTQYDLLKDIAKLAYEFLATFEITDVEEGIKVYCNLGFQLMNKKYALNKFKYYNSKINESYRYYTLLQNDDNKKATKEFILLWKSAMAYYGAEIGLVKLNAEKNVSFLFARQDADAAKADYKDWIRAQFEELAFLSSLPEVSQLHGDPALSRYQKYMANIASRDKKATKEDVGYITEEHADYLKKIKN